MSNPRPINLLHAIDAVAFVVAFNRPFTQIEENKLLTLKESLKKELPHFSQDVEFEAQVENGELIKQTARKTGVKLQHIKSDGKVSWMLHIVGNQIIITCRTYDRWEKVWDKANTFMKAALKPLQLESLEVNFCLLQYIDRFIEEDNRYDIYGVFDRKTKYLTKNTTEIGVLWHVHQGWFEEKSKDDNVLNVLNLGTKKEEKKIVTTIDHASHLQFPDSIKAKIFFGKGKTSRYEKAFAFLHEHNKTVLKNLLNQKQKKTISLT